MKNSRTLAAAYLLSALFHTGSTFADENQKDTKALFDKGVEEMVAGHYDNACPYIAESYRLDPRPGTLFTLAACETNRGHIATAVAHYDEYLALYATLPPGQKAQQGTRQTDSMAQKAALAPQVPRLTLLLPPNAPRGTVVKRDGAELSEAEVGVMLAVDPGEHVITTEAPGGPIVAVRATLRKGEQRTIALQVTGMSAGPPAQARRTMADPVPSGSPSPPIAERGQSGRRMGADFSFKLEPGAAFPLDGPQKRDFGVGVGGMLKGALGIMGLLDLQVTGLYAGFPGSSNGTRPGMGGVGGGARIQRPHGSGRVSPWGDVDLLYVGTGGLNRFSFAGAVGVNFAVEPSRMVWLGLFARYLHVVQPNMPGFDNTDGKFFFIGVSAEAGNSRVPDADGDGVPDTDDRCPREVGPASSQGCPIVDKDADADEVLDKADKCPTVPGPRDNDGCPYGDADADGLLDKDDKCPMVPGPASNHGCPELDTDGDGVSDKEDRCPNQPGPAALHGCPDPDGDGLVPPEDKCPEKAGPRENDGCPVYKTIKVTKERIELGQKIFFAFGKSTILPKSFELLNEVAQALKDYPEMRVGIEGHTDNVGLSAQNLTLSEVRAAAVRQYMIERGVAADRLSSKGYGDTLPLESNSTAEGREKNRRVEFVVHGKPDRTGEKPDERIK